MQLRERLAKAQPQLRVLPNRVLHDTPKQTALFACGLALEQFGRFTGEGQYIDSFGCGSQSSRLALIYLCSEALLIGAHLLGFLVIRASVDSPVETIIVEHVEPRLKPVQFRLISMQGLCARGSFGDVVSNDNLPQPFEHGLGNDEGTQMPCEKVGQLFFARVGLRALPAVSGAMVVHVASFLQLTDEGTSAMAAFEEARECEIVSYLSVFSLVATIQNFLAALPHFPAHQRLMNPLVDCAGVLELARVDAVPKNFMQCRHRDFVLAFTKPKSLFVGLLGERL